MDQDDEKTKLTNSRFAYLNRLYTEAERLRLARLEWKYGKYCFLPYDVPRIEPENPARFLEWWREASKPVHKLYSDIAGGTLGETFRAIDSPNQVNVIWTQNKRSDLFTEFPEIEAGIKSLPFTSPQFSIWESIRPIAPHRDQAAFEDLPASFRVMLYDNNPRSSLFVREVPSKKPPFRLPRLSTTNTFGWNNIRTRHSSEHTAPYFKCLLIFTSMRLDFDRYEDLLERSVAKYGQFALTSSASFNTFVHH